MVEKAGSFDIDQIAAASPGVEFKDAPEGYVSIHENHHLWSKTRVGRARADGQHDVIYETADLMEPDPSPRDTSETPQARRRQSNAVGKRGFPWPWAAQRGSGGGVSSFARSRT
jgi:hypothetical protein